MTTLLSSPLNLTNGAGCQTVSAPSPQTVAPGGFLKLEIGVTWNMSATPGGASNVNQTTLELGRATATYT